MIVLFTVTCICLRDHDDTPLFHNYLPKIVVTTSSKAAWDVGTSEDKGIQKLSFAVQLPGSSCELGPFQLDHIALSPGDEFKAFPTKRED